MVVWSNSAVGILVFFPLSETQNMGKYEKKKTTEKEYIYHFAVSEEKNKGIVVLFSLNVFA